MLALAYSVNASVLPWGVGSLPAAVNIAENPLTLRIASPWGVPLTTQLAAIQPQAISLSQGLAAQTLLGPQIVNGVTLQAARVAPVTTIAASVAHSPIALGHSQLVASPFVRTVAAPIAIAAAEGNYLAATRGAVHSAPLPGHLQSAQSLNLEPAPGTL